MGPRQIGIKMHRVNRKAGQTPGGQLYLPAAIAAAIPAGERFRCELVEEGVLFRRVTEGPAWLNPKPDAEAAE